MNFAILERLQRNSGSANHKGKCWSDIAQINAYIVKTHKIKFLKNTSMFVFTNGIQNVSHLFLIKTW